MARYPPPFKTETFGVHIAYLIVALVYSEELPLEGISRAGFFGTRCAVNGLHEVS